MNARIPMSRLIASCVIGVLALSTAHAATLHVAPNGTADGDGSEAKPLSFAVAISSKSPAKPGDTILLRGGQYDGPITSKPVKGQEQERTVRTAFQPKLSGTKDAPIIITSAPGEWAHLNGTIHVQGANYLHFIRLEVGDLKWDVSQKTHIAPTAFNVVQGLGIKIINCNIFGGAMGTGLWTPAENLEAYGNLVHDFGYTKSKGDRGHGHAFYVQNNEGTKTISRNIAYRSCGWLYDIYTQQGKINGFDIIENIGYLAGHHKPGQTSFSFGLTGWKPAERIRFIGNVAYQARDAQQWRANMRLMTHLKKDVVHVDAVVQDNVIMGAYRALVIGQWENATITGNTFWSTGFLAEISSAPSGSGIPVNDAAPVPSNYTIDNNTYIDTGAEKPFVYGRHEKIQPDEMLTFAEWQELGFDVNSKMLPGRDGRPTGTQTIVFDNKYEAGRGNVAVFNWDGVETVEVDLSTVLKPGQGYVVYNCQDIKQTIGQAKPVLTGTYESTPIAFRMRRDPQSPEFDAFLVLPTK